MNTENLLSKDKKNKPKFAKNSEKTSDPQQTETPPPPPKIPTAEYFKAVSHAIDASSLSALPKFPVRYWVYEDKASKQRVAVRETAHGSNVVEITCLDTLASDILNYTARYVGKDAYQWDYEKCLKCARYWKAYTKPIEEPSRFAWAGTEERTFNRLPWHRTNEIGPMPLWDEFMGRMSNAAAFKMFVGSLFDAAAYTQQYIWVQGEGNDTKGAFARVLEGVFGEVFAGVSAPESAAERRFIAASIKDKSVVVFNECEAYSFPRSSLFKSLTGGDRVTVEGKGVQGYSGRINARYFFLSNGYPNISSQRADLRRLIYCKLKTYEGEIYPSFEGDLWKEAGHFFNHCIELYLMECGSGRPVPTDDKDGGVAELVDQFEEPLALFAEKYLVFSPANYCRAGVLAELIKGQFPRSRADQLRMVRYLEQRHGVKRQSKKEDGSVVKVYMGCRIRNDQFR